ncbi:MAG: hypothetical protein ACUZ8H_01540 [Candidatus Anammoxibacter sp.]
MLAAKGKTDAEIVKLTNVSLSVVGTITAKYWKQLMKAKIN